MALLLVEDDLDLAEPLTALLAQQGYQVTAVRDGETAYGLVKQHHYELLILDWLLPRLDGLTLCQRLRREGVTTPVLFLTARDGVTDRVQGLDAGADDYLVKPFAFAELAARVRALLRRPPPTSPTRLQVGDLVLLPEQRLAYRGDRPIVLSEKETQLLALLLQQPGQILSHTQLLACLWPGETPDRNLLAAHIRLLRRKLEAQGEPPVIQTAYGRGYGLLVPGADRAMIKGVGRDGKAR
ncbi:MAG: response regulator transcription factor [Gloeomargarita sp. SKYBB_i_bin120]|nr:response regulator transcription factor [Gloeomargarita sp. SKYG98]MCS7291948.1 response regulator transcription factor [Gloeomargarita sp. SKYB120]MDW8177508.1 response regulator transcription factor [Gloeomargarita sp. SKYBB_i_bin120]